jgi:hypothetical protein
MRTPIAAAFVCTLLASLWITFTVQRNYRGSTTGLFCIGDFFEVPEELVQRPLHRFTGSKGFDGEFYLVIAHDPFLKLGYDRFVDWPSLRYRRILVPLLANLTAVSRAAIPFAYVCWMLTFLFVGVWLSGSVARGLVFAVLPSTWISLDRMILDMPLLAFLAVALHLWNRGDRHYWAALPLALACLTRETGVVLSVGFALAALLAARRWRLSALLLGSAVPAALWSGWLSMRFETHMRNWTQLQLNSFGILGERLLDFPSAAGLERILLPLDFLAFCGFLAALIWGLLQFRRRDPLGLVAFLQAALCVYLIGVEDWTHVYDHGRLSAAILLAMGFEAVDQGNWRLLIPIATLTLRVAAQMSPQVYRFAF